MVKNVVLPASAAIFVWSPFLSGPVRVRPKSQAGQGDKVGAKHSCSIR